MQLAIFAELVSPTMVLQSNGNICKVMPNMYRSAISKYLGPGGDRILLRLVSVNSYYFHLIVPLKKLPSADFDEIVFQFSETLKGVVRLSPEIGEVTIHTSPQDGIRSMVPQLKAHRDQYSKFFANKKRSKE